MRGPVGHTRRPTATHASSGCAHTTVTFCPDAAANAAAMSELGCTRVLPSRSFSSCMRRCLASKFVHRLSSMSPNSRLHRHEAVNSVVASSTGVANATCPGRKRYVPRSHQWAAAVSTVFRIATTVCCVATRVRCVAKTEHCTARLSTATATMVRRHSHAPQRSQPLISVVRPQQQPIL
jgi:hypothetical protein